MSYKLFQGRSRFARRISVASLALLMFVLSSAAVSANSTCFQVKGHYEEHAVGGPECSSPVGLCIAGEYGGVVQGDFFSTVTSLNPTGDTPATSVVLFTADSTIHAKVHGLQGDLTIKNAGAFQSAGEGNIVDVQYITGGTDQLSGASGVIRASGLFDPTAGQGASDYEGMVCLP